MNRLVQGKNFLVSNSGRGFLLFLCFCAMVSWLVGIESYRSSLAGFKTQKSEEKITALQLVDAFVTNYSDLRSRLASDAPVPATYRAHSIELFNKARGSDANHESFRLRWVGRPGRAIVTPPDDDAMARTIESFATMRAPQPVSDLLTLDGKLVFRTVYPSIAEKSCVACHNKLQPDKTQWQVGDVMGAFSIDVPIGPFLHATFDQCLELALALFFALGAAGFGIAVLHYRQSRERETAQTSLAASEEKFRDFAEAASDWFWEEDENLRLAYLSQNAQATRHGSRRNFLGKTLRENFPAGMVEEQWRSLDEDHATRRPFQNYRLQVVTRRGEPRHFSLSGKPIFDATGRFRGYRGTGRDVTNEIAAELELAQRVEERTSELRAAQHELVNKERLSALGQLTATVAHELRNPLSAIRNTVFVIKDGVAKAGLALERPITRIERNIGRCDRIISDLLDYTRVRELQCMPVLADRWFHDVISEQHPPDGIVLACKLEAPNCTINCDAERLRRVVINLVENAAQAMADPEASTGERRITAGTRTVGNSFEFVIEDTGPGIANDVLPKVFEPLFSTKSFGTGLGLPMVKQIVEQHGGSIEIFSEAGKGARVVVRLPISSVEEIAA